MLGCAFAIIDTSEQVIQLQSMRLIIGGFLVLIIKMHAFLILNIAYAFVNH